MSALEVFWLAELTKVIKKYCLIPPSFLPIFFCFLDYFLLSLFGFLANCIYGGVKNAFAL